MPEAHAKQLCWNLLSGGWLSGGSVPSSREPWEYPDTSEGLSPGDLD